MYDVVLTKHQLEENDIATGVFQYPVLPDGDQLTVTEDILRRFVAQRHNGRGGRRPVRTALSDARIPSRCPLTRPLSSVQDVVDDEEFSISALS